MFDRAFDRAATRYASGSFALRVPPRLLRWPTIDRSNLSGAFADLGLLIPLEASLIALNGLNPGVDRRARVRHRGPSGAQLGPADRTALRPRTDEPRRPRPRRVLYRSGAPADGATAAHDRELSCGDCRHGARVLPQAARVTPKRLSLSIALANLWAGFAGGLLVCHGSGGLTAHYSFGARRRTSTAITGMTLIAVALLFGHAGLVVRHVVPLRFFGLLLLFVGI